MFEIFTKMTNLRYAFAQIFACTAIIASAQCSFQYISNDTAFQDYIEFICPRKHVNEIIGIGTRVNRGIINDSVFNAPVFQIFDDCGNILNQTVYKYVGNSRLIHKSIPTHRSYKAEPIGNTTIKIKEDEFLIVDRAYDTSTNEFQMILFKINENGVLKSYNTTALNISEINQTTVKHVLLLKDNKILVIVWDNAEQYTFYYFDENLNYLFKKSLSLVRGIRAIKEVDNGEFICTSLVNDNSAFQFYRFDTIGEMKWIVSPYNNSGSAREILIENNKLYITGNAGAFGVFLICDMKGSVITEFKYDTFFCEPRFCSAFLDSDSTFTIGGYIKHCDLADTRGSDIAIIRIDASGKILWDKLYDFRNTLGTSDSKGYYNDSGGFVLAKTTDGAIITTGMSKYSRMSPGGIYHEDAVLIKTDPIVVPSKDLRLNFKKDQFYLLGNLVEDHIIIEGPVNLIKNWSIYSLTGDLLLNGYKWSNPVNISSKKEGMYALKIMDRNNIEYLLKFVKI